MFFCRLRAYASTYGKYDDFNDGREKGQYNSMFGYSINIFFNELLIYSGLTFQLSFLTKLNSKITRAL